MSLNLSTPQPLEPQPSTPQIIVANTNAIAQHTKTYKISPVMRFKQLAFGWM
jgi:hypothetical protein